MPGGARIVLASTSRYRGELLRRLLPTFDQRASGVDEQALPGEPAATRAARLAEAKARALSANHAGALLIGSDQVAEIDGQALGKPGDTATARTQLARCSGRAVQFHTAVCVLDTRGDTPVAEVAVDLTRVHFRNLDGATIARYIEAEQPLDCAGSFKCEGLGIALFERIENDDPTALVGLPLIALARLLRRCGVEVP